MKIQVSPENCVGCFNCMLACSFTFEQAFNIFEARLTIESSDGEGFKIDFKDTCTKCGICADYCLYDALEKVEEDSK